MSTELPSGIPHAGQISTHVAGRYELLERIGGGRLSDVHRARDLWRGGDLVALKLLATGEPDPLITEIFRREIEALELVEHPHVVRILDHGYCADLGRYYVSMELMHGSLLEKINNPPVERHLEWALSISTRLSEALAVCHSRGIIHRDIKPANILLDEIGEPRISDFGSSRLKYQLNIGQTVGHLWSPGYAAPEQRRGESGNEQSDIYALGALICHLLAREAPPADGPTRQTVDSATVQPDLRKLLLAMLEQDPENRPADSSVIHRTLLQIEGRVAERPIIWLMISGNAIKDLTDLRLISNRSHQAAADFLIDELGGQDLESVPVAMRSSEEIRVFGRKTLLICAPHTNAPALAVKAVHIPYDPEREQQQQYADLVSAQWEPVSQDAIHRMGDVERQQLHEDFYALLSGLRTHQERTKVTRARKKERTELVEQWELVLQYLEERLAHVGHQLEYDSVRERDDLLYFRLSQTPPDDIKWEEGFAIAVKRNQYDGHSVLAGELLVVGNTEIVVSVDDSLIGSSGRTGKDRLPGRGVLTLYHAEQRALLARERDALRSIRFGLSHNTRLGEVLTDIGLAELEPVTYNIEPFQSDLASDQLEAIHRALQTRDVFLMQGPPGTGKTTVIVELILQILSRKPEARILISSQSNVAVNHVLSRLGEFDVAASKEIVRLGRTEKIAQGAEVWGMDQRIRRWRSRVVERCRQVLSELRRGEIQTEIVPEFDTESLEEFLTWVDEAEWLIERREEHSARYSEVCDALEAIDGEDRPDAYRELLAEYRQLDEDLEAIDSRIIDQLSTVADLLPERVRGRTAQTSQAEVERLRRLLSQLLESQAGDNGNQPLRSLVREWIDVVEVTHEFMNPLLQRAQVVATTCLWAGRKEFRESTYDWVIVDEAGRATAPEILIPMVRGRRVVLVGDERQLPPMIDDGIDEDWLDRNGIRREAIETSLFETLVVSARQDRPEALMMLTTQHRMHPVIGDLVSSVFYDGQLQHGENTETHVDHLDWPPAPITWLSTSSFTDRREIRHGTSYANPREIALIEKVMRRLEASYRKSGLRREVAIISGYSAQRQELSSRLDPSDSSRWQALDIEIDTVDGFQGRDRDIVVYSGVRSNPDGNIGFLRDQRRLNVALSRGRYLLIIVGDESTLVSSHSQASPNPFREVLDYMLSHQDRCCLTNATDWDE